MGTDLILLIEKNCSLLRWSEALRLKSQLLAQNLDPKLMAPANPNWDGNPNVEEFTKH
jgi:hypothetical protein